MHSFTKKMIKEKSINGVSPREYKNTLFEKKQIRHKIKRMQSKYHQLGTY